MMWPFKAKHEPSPEMAEAIRQQTESQEKMRAAIQRRDWLEVFLNETHGKEPKND